MATLIVQADCAAPATIGRGGMAVYLLQWLHGFERLGLDVFFIEFLQEHPGQDLAPPRYFEEIMTRWWHPEKAALLVMGSGESLYGLRAEQVRRLSQEAAAVIRLGAYYSREPYPLIGEVRPRVLIDQDPGYTHLWAVADDPAAIFGEHDVYYTIGSNVGSARCALPTLGIRWRHLWNPVILDWWLPACPVRRDRFTTIGDWRGYGYLEFEGRMLGPKSEEFRKFLHLPARAGESLEVVLNIGPDDPDFAELQGLGWKVESPEVVASPALFRDYVAGSLGEFSCAKGGYAGTRCGWFGDRAGCYLAAGRPVILQAAGFEDLIPTGKGLFAVADVGEAAEAIRAIRRDYPLHAAAARALACEYLDSDKVLGRLLAEIGIKAAKPRRTPMTLPVADSPAGS